MVCKLADFPHVIITHDKGGKQHDLVLCAPTDSQHKQKSGTSYMNCKHQFLHYTYYVHNT